ncbi:hypothetical protein SteCoe_33589 [Stentor coeruleus]|uniref:Uncharacterized protein n=1 Tax=Stentor coeruleus TaxID=5963 RepID=A0A1R2AWE8_9CILI|nr:hypothetical protein SteCoe_33589 [Stentor coeruleus]
MDDQLSIFNVTFDSVLRQKDSLRLPSLSKKLKNPFSSKNPKNRSPKLKKPSNQSTARTIQKNSYSESSSKKSQIFDQSDTHLTQILWKSKDINLNPKLTYLISAVPKSLTRKSRNSYNILSNKITKNPQLIDWKISQLDTYVSNDKCTFNWQNDPSLLTDYQVSQYDEVPNGIVFKNCLKNTVRKLCQELMQNYDLVDKVTEKQVLLTCKELFEIRNATLLIIRKIIRREKIIKEIFDNNGENDEGKRDSVVKLTMTIKTLIGKWKKYEISTGKFIYGGENYLRKMKNDLVLLEKPISNNNIS